MLSPQEQQQFSWLYWLFAAAVPAAAMLALYAAGVALFFRSDETPALSKQQVDVQLRLLGKLKRREWASIAGIGLFVVGILTTSIHNVQPPWLGMAILYGLLLYGYLNRREFREKTDWPGLVYLGTLVGVIGTFNYLGLDRWLTTELSGLADVLRTSFGVFVALLFGLVAVLRFAFPSSATIAICATIFMPVASQAGVSPWVVGFMLLTFSDMWIFPFQSPQYQQFHELLRDKRLYDERAFLRFNLFVNAVRLAGVYAAIPFWEHLGLV